MADIECRVPSGSAEGEARGLAGSENGVICRAGDVCGRAARAGFPTRIDKDMANPYKQGSSLVLPTTGESLCVLL